MEEQELKIFNQDVEAILNGQMVDKEALTVDYREDLILVERLCKADFSGESGNRHSLKERLWDKIRGKGIRPAVIGFMGKKSGLLSEEDLGMVAAGGANTPACSQCHCSLTSQEIFQEICPACGHPRTCHR
jgi:hypothetical protein